MSYKSKYTGPQIDDILDSVGGKQNEIEDLASIRSGAAKGATALQSYTEKYTGTYSKPSTGIPKSDLASAVQTSLGKADTALQSYTEQYKGTVTKVKINGEEKSPNSSGIVDLGTISVESNAYLTDFTYEDFIAIYEGEKDSATCNFQNLKAAIDEGKTIVIPMNNDVPNGYIPDIEIYDTEYYLYIHRFLSYIEIYFDSSDTSTQLDSSYLYSQEAHPRLTSGNNIKTIGGQSVLGSGDIAFKTVEGENILGSGNISISHPWPDWVTPQGVLGHINNRTHYAHGIYITAAGAYDCLTHKVLYNGTLYELDADKTVELNSGPSTTVTLKYQGSWKVVVVTNGTWLKSNPIISDPVFVPLDERYIPETIARKSEFKTINGTSILGSGDITISGGSSSGSGAYAEVNHGTSDTTFALTPNTFHVWDEVSALTLTLGSETAGVANEFLFQFTSGATATSLTLPDDIKWANDAPPTIEPNMIYQVSILKGLASVLEFSNAVEKRENLIDGQHGSYLISSQYPVASDITIEYWDNFYDDIYTVTMLAGTSEVATSERFGYIENLSPKEDDQFYYLYYNH